MYTLQQVRQGMLPVLEGMKLIKGNPFIQLFQWFLLLSTQFIAIIPLLALLTLLYIINLDRALSPMEFYTLVWCSFELEFYVVCFFMYNKLSAPQFAPSFTQKDRMSQLNQFLTYSENLDVVMKRWFHLSQKESLSFNNIKTVLSWFFFDKKLTQLSSDDMANLDELAQHVFKVIPDLVEHSSDLDEESCMMLNHDPVVVQHKPLIFYLGVWAGKAIGIMTLLSFGFRRHKAESMNYWIINEDNKTDLEPVVFCHGIGAGLVMYARMVSDILKLNPNRKVVLVEIDSISLSITGNVLSMDQFLKGIDFVFATHKFGACTWMGHSYGTIVAAWATKERPQYIKKLIMVDPVCFFIWEPSLILNFLYSEAKTFTHFIMQFYIARDMYTSYTLRRNFWWNQNALYPKDIANIPTKIFLSEEDAIIDAPVVHKYLRFCTENLKNSEVDITMFPETPHGGYLKSKKHSNIIMTHV